MSNFTSINPSQFTQLLNALNSGGGGGGGGSYTLPVASDSVLGGVKIGNGLSIENDGKLNVNATVSSEVQYSTTEKRIGTWVDGTPLFEKTLVGTIQLNGQNDEKIIGNISELLGNVSIKFFDTCMTNSSFAVDSSLVQIYVLFNDNNIYVKQKASSSNLQWAYNIRFRYTKN